MSARVVRASASAKINLHLGVGPVRPDGYHPLATVYQALSLRDVVEVRTAAAWSVQVGGERAGVVPLDLPLGEDNLVVRAGRALAAHHGVDAAAAVRIEKTIPVAGGMAGGSADAAAALVALDRLWDLGTSSDDLAGIAASLGSDVPFALVGGTAVGEGRGEVVTPVVDVGTWWWVAVLSGKGLATPSVYRRFDELARAVGTPSIPPGLRDALAAGAAAGLAAHLGNDLQEPALDLRPDLRDVLALGPAVGALAALLSGSGPTCLFLADGEPAAYDVRSRLHSHGIDPALTLVAHGPDAGARVEAE